ncbi:MAG TPA: FadR/GntR family transcriptional regulator [Bryobacteraceae bacterium]|nr:FadR/GntR family transcriptional regulator [Bryobacteraceae bacterium]
MAQALLQKRSFRRGRLSEQLVTELETMILQEYPEVGSCLPKEEELAKRFGVSRIVVREAMKILEDRGLVEVRAGRGTRTVGRGWERVKDALFRVFNDQPIPTLADTELMLELRQVLEETAAELAAVRATPEDLQEIEAALAAMGSGAPEAETIEADLRFHQAVARASHNRYLATVIEPLTHVYLQQIRLTNAYTVGVELHRHIFVAIQTANPIAARQAVRRLMRDTRNHAKMALQSLISTQS